MTHQLKKAMQILFSDVQYLDAALIAIGIVTAFVAVGFL